jgi:hypothetical protein
MHRPRNCVTLTGKCIASIAMRARMFAGRYLWWTMIAIAIFLFSAVYFDYVAWAIIQASGCGSNATSCDTLSAFLAGTVKPAGFWLAGGIMLVCTLARIRYLGLGVLWAFAVAVWFLAAAPFPMLFANIWNGQLQFETILAAVPVPVIFLAFFTAYLLLPVEDDERRPLSMWKAPRYAAGIAAGHSTLWTLANEPNLPLFLTGKMHMSSFGAMVRQMQPQLKDLAEFGTGGTVFLYIGLSIFVLALLTSLLPHEKIEAGWLTLQLLMTSESPRRRSSRG